MEIALVTGQQETWFIIPEYLLGLAFCHLVNVGYGLAINVGNNFNLHFGTLIELLDFLKILDSSA